MNVYDMFLQILFPPNDRFFYWGKKTEKLGFREKEYFSWVKKCTYYKKIHVLNFFTCVGGKSQNIWETNTNPGEFWDKLGQKIKRR